MQTEKQKVLTLFPDLSEKIVHRLHPVGKKGHCKLIAMVQVWYKDTLLSEKNTYKAAYKTAASVMKRHITKQPGAGRQKRRTSPT